MMDFSADVRFVQPELWLAVFALLGAVAGAWLGDRSARLLSWLCAAVLIAAGSFWLVYWPAAPVTVFGGALVTDGVSALGKALIAYSAAATLLLGADHFSRTRQERFELPIMVALAVIGMFVMISARDLITLYVGLELQSLAGYVLAAWLRDEVRSSEAGLKYFVLGAIASGLLLFGASLVYGFAGSVRFTDIAAAAGQGGIGLLFGLVLMICALGFKMSAAPFHMWTPDVYEGAPTPITAFFAGAPKVAAVLLLARLVSDPFAAMAVEWRQVVAALAAISMLVGGFGALLQTNLKRLMAYSSINNMGFVLMALVGAGEGGVEGALIFLSVYLPATIGVFALILALRREGRSLENVDDLAGLASRRPLLAALFTALLFSLAGVPPLAGFWGKVQTFAPAIAAGFWPLAVVGAVAAAVAVAYYLRVVAAIWFKPPGEGLERASGTVVLTATAATLLVFPLLLFALGAMQNWAASAVASSF